MVEGGIGERVNGEIDERVNGGIRKRVDGGIGERIDGEIGQEWNILAVKWTAEEGVRGRASIVSRRGW